MSDLSSSSAAGRPLVLIAEDDADILTAYLSRSGLRSVRAANGGSRFEIRGSTNHDSNHAQDETHEKERDRADLAGTRSFRAQTDRQNERLAQASAPSIRFQCGERHGGP
ncbi:hypothetical protein [Burkholderia pyrrocinia]|uniref:hypothetical protein n=1 Tax=Burkholderia pyrrocinia TaxID=60550 RepID=UPI00158B5DBC